MRGASVTYIPIGMIHSCHTEAKATPIQPVYAAGCAGRAEIFPEYSEGLSDLEDFSHIYLLYHFHKAGPPRLKVKPFLDDVERGVFAARTPFRPNPLGLSIVRLLRREGNLLFLDGVDILDGTPLLDVKPYTARFDRIDTLSNGWQDALSEKVVAERSQREYRKTDAGQL